MLQTTKSTLKSYNQQKSYQYLLFICVTLSGLSSLVYELVWTRALNLVFGVSHLAIATVSGVFLMGLASGSYLFGSLSERTKNVVGLYACFEFLIGICSVFSWFGLMNFSVFNQVYYSIYNSHNTTFLMLGRLFFASIILLPPTLLIGGTIPLMARIFLQNEKKIGLDFSKIYFLNTFGGLIGVLLCGFFLIQTYGVNTSFLCAVVINVMVGIILLIVSKNYLIGNKQLNNKQSLATKPRLLFALFLSGFVSLGFENLLVRIQNIFSSNTTYSFTAILSGYLAGISLGSMIVSKLYEKRQATTSMFFILAIAMGLVGQLTLMYFSRHFVENLWGQLAQGFIGSLVFASFPGMLFPMGVGIYLGTLDKIATNTGVLYFINTIGAVLGSLVSGFIIIPTLGIHNGSLFFASIPFILIFLFPLPQKSWYWAPISLLALSIFSYQLTSKQFSESIPSNAKLIYYQEGLSGTVTIKEKSTSRGIYRQMAIDDNGVSSNNPKMLIDAKLLAHLPLLLHQNPHTVATVGFGTGGTSRSMLLHGAKTFALEIEEKIVEGSKLFPDMSAGVLEHENFHLILDDARSFLNTSNQMFDVIVTDCTNLKYKSNALLYTSDFFKIMKSRLLTGGIAAAWVPLAGLSTSDLKILIASFQEVYPNMTIWLYSRSITHFVVFVGTQAPLKVDILNLRKRMQQEKIKQDLASIGMTNEYYFASMLLLRENDIKRMVKDVKIHTDDLPVLEFSDIDHYLKPSVLNNLEALLEFQSNTNHEAFSDSYQANIRRSMQELKSQLKRLIAQDKNKPYLRD